jgi:hypothetical protein
VLGTDDIWNDIGNQPIQDTQQEQIWKTLNDYRQRHRDASKLFRKCNQSPKRTLKSKRKQSQL